MAKLRAGLGEINIMYVVHKGSVNDFIHVPWKMFSASCAISRFDTYTVFLHHYHWVYTYGILFWEMGPIESNTRCPSDRTHWIATIWGQTQFAVIQIASSRQR